LKHITETIAIASYVEQMLAAEQQWIMNRLQWLFTSQSFLIAAFVGLIVSAPPTAEVNMVQMLKIALPIVGVVFCAFVGAAVFAAERVGHLLGDERARLSKIINEACATNVPLIGTSDGLRHPKWTLTIGSLPHRFLPGSLAVLWVVLLCYVRN